MHDADRIGIKSSGVMTINQTLDYYTVWVYYICVVGRVSCLHTTSKPSPASTYL